MSTREAFVEKTKAKLNELNAEVARLEAKAKVSGTDLRVRYEEEIGKLKERREEVKATLDEFRRASESAWADLKIGLEAAWDILDTAIDSARERFK